MGKQNLSLHRLYLPFLVVVVEFDERCPGYFQGTDFVEVDQLRV